MSKKGLLNVAALSHVLLAIHPSSRTEEASVKRGREESPDSLPSGSPETAVTERTASASSRALSALGAAAPQQPIKEETLTTKRSALCHLGGDERPLHLSDFEDVQAAAASSSSSRQAHPKARLSPDSSAMPSPDRRSVHAVGSPQRLSQYVQTPERVRSAEKATVHIMRSPHAERVFYAGVAALADTDSPTRRRVTPRLRRGLQKATEAAALTISPFPLSVTGSPERPSRATVGAHASVHALLRSPKGERLRRACEALTVAAKHPPLSLPAVRVDHVLKPDVHRCGRISGYHFCEPGAAEKEFLRIEVENPTNGVYYGTFSPPELKKKSSTFFPMSLGTQAHFLEEYARKTVLGSRGEHYICQLPTGVHFIVVSKDSLTTMDTMFPCFHVAPFEDAKPFRVQFNSKDGEQVLFLSPAEVLAECTTAIKYDTSSKSASPALFTLSSAKEVDPLLLVDITYLVKSKASRKLPKSLIWVKIPLSKLESDAQANAKTLLGL